MSLQVPKESLRKFQNTNLKEACSIFLAGFAHLSMTV